MRFRPRATQAALAIQILVAAFAEMAQAEPSLEQQVKAAYVSKIARFVEWPEEHPVGDTLRIGVAGSETFREAMRALHDTRLGEVSVEVRVVAGPEDLDRLHMLVIGTLPSPLRTRAYLRAARDRPILTIGETEAFLEEGGILQFVAVEDTIRFAISVEASRRAGLALSSRLLKLAINLRPGEPD